MAQRPNESQEARTQDPQSGQIARRSQGGGLTRSGRDSFTSMSPRDFFRASPFALMRRMTEDFDRMWNNFGAGQGEGTWSPAIEVAERDGNFVVHAELPGLKPEDVHLEVTDNALVVRGERKFEHKDEKGGVQRTERSYGEFYRSIPLPEGIDADQVKAKFDNGILEVTAPMPPRQSNSREIPIQAASSQNKPNQTEVTH